MKNLPPTRGGRGYYAPARKNTSLGVDLTVAVPGVAVTAKGIPTWLAFAGVAIAVGGAVHFGKRLGVWLTS